MNKEEVKQYIGIKAPIRELLALIDIKDSKDKNLKITTDSGGGKQHAIFTNTSTGITILTEAFHRYETKLEDIPAQLLNILDRHPETTKEIIQEIKKAGN